MKDRNIQRRAFLKGCCAGLACVGSADVLGSAFADSGVSRQPKKPNVLIFLADDMGYSDAECYGGDVRSPNLSALAANGLRFTQHYSTGRCWPSRASIMSGYYAQQIRADGLPGVVKQGIPPSWTQFLPEMLSPYGYQSYHSGKWHIKISPEAAGFDRSWGGKRDGCDWDRFFDSKPWQEDEFSAPVKPGEHYYSTVAIADHTIACLKLHQKNHSHRPFFQYTAFYSPHFPLHAMQKDIEKYKDAYLEGWDVIRQRRWARMKKMGLVNCALSDKETNVIPNWNLRPEELNKRIGAGEVDRAVDWDSLTDEQKQFQAGKMAVHAAMISRMDSEIGRIIQQLKDMGEYENTLILFASDNGASAEQFIRGDGHDPEAAMGSAKSFLCLGPGWSTAANTPFRFHKFWNHEGGIASPLIAHWPKGIKAKNELRHDPSHFIDIVPTVLEIASGERVLDNYTSAAVPRRPGRSLIPAFDKSGAVGHEALWWYHGENRAIRMGDWKLSATPFDNDTKGRWELYNLNNDRCETNDLALEYPEKVEQLNQRWEEIVEGFRKDLKSK